MPDSLKSFSYLPTPDHEDHEGCYHHWPEDLLWEKDNKKILNVHKNFFCANSPVLRATIMSNVNEIYMEEVDEKTVEEIIHYIYLQLKVRWGWA